MNLNYQDFDWKNILIKRYPSYQLSELDVMVIFVSDNVLKLEENVFLTQDILSNYMTSSREDIDQSLSKLIKKKVLEVIPQDKGMRFSLEKFKETLYNDVVKDIALNERIGRNSIGLTGDLSQSVEDLIGRVLSPTERDHISAWLKNGADEGMVKEAVSKSLSPNGYFSMKKADKLILELNRSKSIQDFGVSTIDEGTRKRQEISDLLKNTDWTYHGNKDED